MPLNRRVFAVLAALVASSLAPAARADGNGETCATAYEEAQQHVKAHSPIRARSELRLCLTACPAVLARDCSQWLGEVEAEVASLRVKLETASGEPTIGEITIDDGPAIATSGDAIEVDPGEHHLVAKDGHGGTVETRITLAAAQRDVVVRLIFPPISIVPPPLAPRVGADVPRSRVPVVLIAAGLGGLTAGATLGAIGEVQRHRLITNCAPGCHESQLDPIRAEWITGGAIATVGLIAVVSGVVWIASTRTSPSNLQTSFRGVAFSF